MKLQPRKLQSEEKEKYIKALDALYIVIAGLKNRDEVKSLLRVVLTESERLMIGRRLLIAQMLLHDICYNKIVDELGVGIDTIMRMHKILESEEAGIKRAVKNLEKELESRKRII